MYTPFRLNPRIFPAVVSATVAASEAMTRLRPQPPAAGSAFGGAFAADRGIAVLGRMMELANPAPKVAMLPTNERLPLEGKFNWFFDFFSM
jgi:hypothetical protein